MKKNDKHAFSYRQAELLAEAFDEFSVDYLFIGKSGALILGFPGTTQDVDVYPRKDPDNCGRIVDALKSLGFKLNAENAAAIRKGKDFVQIRNGPFDLDLVFAPDGLENYDEVKKRSVVMGKFRVAHIDDIIRSKEAARRDRDLRDLPLLREFAKVFKDRRIR